MGLFFYALDAWVSFSAFSLCAENFNAQYNLILECITKGACLAYNCSVSLPVVKDYGVTFPVTSGLITVLHGWRFSLVGCSYSILTLKHLLGAGLVPYTRSIVIGMTLPNTDLSIGTWILCRKMTRNMRSLSFCKWLGWPYQIQSFLE